MSAPEPSTPGSPGGRVTSWAPIHMDAIVSGDGRYRYDLTRRWDDRPMVCWVMLNPSIADAEVDDLTIKKCMGFTRRWGWGGIRVVNLIPFRATHPEEMLVCTRPFGLGNETYVEAAIAFTQFTVAAWGATLPSWAAHWVDLVVACCEDHHRPLRCLGTTKNGSPRHPSRLGYGTTVEMYPSGRADPP